MNPSQGRPETKPDLETKETQETASALNALSAGVAHEIRNPLAAIQSLVELLAQKTEDKKQKELAEAIVTEVARLNRFLEEFLRYGKTPALKCETISVKALVEKVLTFAMPPKQDSKIIVHTHIPEGLPAVEIDPEAYHQVLLNAVLNAVQAMRGGGTLDIRASVLDGHFIMQIKDSGPGISPENREKMFLPFFTTKRGGSGLGLAIAHQIIRQHGGSIYFENNIGEKGVTLFIDVPQQHAE